MKFKNRLILFFIYCAFFSCLLPVAYFTYKHPAYNFDMLGYMAIVVRMDQVKDIKEVHRVTYESAQKIVPGETFKKLTETPAFRKRFATDPLQFEKILPIYSVKPLYTVLCWFFYKSGFSLPAATVMPSILAFLIIGLFLFYWLKKYMAIAVAFLCALLFMLSVFSVAIAGHSTPDCLSALFLFISFYFIIERPNIMGMFFFFLLSIFTRADNVITCFFMLSFLAFSGKWSTIRKPRYFLLVAVLGGAYICAILPVTQFGWNIFYYSQYARHIDFSRDLDQPVALAAYFSMVFSKLVTALVSTQFTFFMFLCLLLLKDVFVRPRNFTFDHSFLILLLSILFFRFLLLPDLSDRFYFSFYLVIVILLVRKFSSAGNTKDSIPR